MIEAVKISEDLVLEYEKQYLKGLIVKLHAIEDKCGCHRCNSRNEALREKYRAAIKAELARLRPKKGDASLEDSEGEE